MSSYKKRVAVVGGGFSGICSIAALKESGFDPVCFEKTDKPGGTWCYREASIDGVPSIMPTTIANHSKEVGALSTFPSRKEYDNYIKHDTVYEYIMNYTRERNILEHIQFNTEVITVRRADDYEETGKWIVTVRTKDLRKPTIHVFGGVLICAGHINRPKVPSYPKQNHFKGDILHTHSLENIKPYRKKRIVVVGMGCSGVDAAVEMSSVGKQVYLSTRSGAHIIKRLNSKGFPYDYIWVRRYVHHLYSMMPFRIISWIVERIYVKSRNEHFSGKPGHPIFSKDPAINDVFELKLNSGLIIQKPDIECFTEDGVIFKGDPEVTKADVVVMATGYKCKFPFLEEGIVVQEDGKINLYKCVFPAQLPHATLAFIGFTLPFKPGFPVMELQSRWAVQVFAGKCKLPKQEEMLKDIRTNYETNLLRYTPSDKNGRVDFMPYCDDIASQFGAKPNLLTLFITDIALFCQLFFGPSLPYQYRLQGPYPWTGAREAIMINRYRILFPFRNLNTADCSQWEIFAKSFSASDKFEVLLGILSIIGFFLIISFIFISVTLPIYS